MATGSGWGDLPKIDVTNTCMWGAYLGRKEVEEESRVSTLEPE